MRCYFITAAGQNFNTILYLCLYLHWCHISCSLAPCPSLTNVSSADEVISNATLHVALFIVICWDTKDGFHRSQVGRSLPSIELNSVRNWPLFKGALSQFEASVLRYTNLTSNGGDICENRTPSERAMNQAMLFKDHRLTKNEERERIRLKVFKILDVNTFKHASKRQH